MPNFAISVNDINQTAANTALGGSATSTQIAGISDNDILVDSGDSWDPDWYYGSPSVNVQVDTNVVNQTAVNTALDGDASSVQVAAIDDRDTLVDHGGDDGPSDFNFDVSVNLINQTAANTAIDLDGLFLG